MNDNKLISDNELHDLLRRRLLQQNMENDELTQKLTDMEAKLVFGNEARTVPSLQKEKQLIKKLIEHGKGNTKWIWYMIVGLVVAAGVYLVSGEASLRSVEERPLRKVATDKTAFAPVFPDAISVVRDIVSPRMPLIDPLSQAEIIVPDSTEAIPEEKWKMGEGLKRPPVQEKTRLAEQITIEANVPVLGSKEIDANNKRKNRMVKALLKKDKESWIYIPTSTDVFNGETISVQAFYMYSGEISNLQYRTFLEDLLVQGRTEDYLKAVPDTARWITAGKEFFLSINPDTNVWTQNGLPFLEPFRKNYWWHPAYENYPVVNVSREAAKMFCDWLTIAANEKVKTGDPGSASLIADLRLPCDVEWMMAARGGAGDIVFPWSDNGNKLPQNSKGCYLANFCIRHYKTDLQCEAIKFPEAYTSAGTFSHDYSTIAPCYSYNGNKYGLYNLSGNVAEMVWENRTNKAMTKGGSWNSDVEHIKINSTENENEWRGSPFIGFRPVFTFTAKKK
jgi:formylglycine-generating enzyme required for sulfatase activity